MFVGRERELNSLYKLYENQEFQFAVVYGRRRVGKTTLINEFIKDKKAIFYMATEGTAADNLNALSQVVLQSQMYGSTDVFTSMPSFSDYEFLLKYIDQICSAHQNEKERLVFVIDEYPYLAASYPPISSMIQKHIDQCWKNSNLFLILCGSSMSFMENQVLGYKSPLYGRRTAQYKLHPFTFFEARIMLADYTKEEQAILYGVTGGIPEYLSRIRISRTMDENIEDLFFDTSGRMFDEPGNLLKQELKNPATYHSIIQAIAGGASRLNEVATKTGLESSGCSAQIQTLISLGLVRKETPITEGENSRKTIYRLEDSMFIFWYCFVRPNLSGITRGIGHYIYQNIVKKQLSDYMGHIFEQICKQYLFLPQIYLSLPFMINNVGPWWGNNAKKRCQEEIDLMSVSQNQAIFCECKWKNEPVSLEVLGTLEERSELFAYSEKYLYLFSKSGYTQQAVDYAENKDRIKLISFENME